CGNDAGMGQADDVERVAAGCRAQPQSLYQRRVAEQGGDAGGGSTLGTQSTFAQMGHIDSPGRSRLNRDIHFEKSPYFSTVCYLRQKSKEDCYETAQENGAYWHDARRLAHHRTGDGQGRWPSRTGTP